MRRLLPGSAAPTALALLASCLLPLAAGAPLAAAADGDPATEAARRHFAQQQDEAPAAMPGADGSVDTSKLDPTASPEAMVSFFTQDEPEDVTVAARRRHVDLDIKFEFDSAELSESGREQLDTAGAALNDPALQAHRFMLAGHTDDVGDPGYNRELSRRRAESAKRYLMEHYEIAADRLETAGFGSDLPKDPRHTPDARQRNRRVVLEMVE